MTVRSLGHIFRNFTNLERELASFCIYDKQIQLNEIFSQDSIKIILTQMKTTIDENKEHYDFGGERSKKLDRLQVQNWFISYSTHKIFFYFISNKKEELKSAIDYFISIYEKNNELPLLHNSFLLVNEIIKLQNQWSDMVLDRYNILIRIKQALTNESAMFAILLVLSCKSS